ncbi:4-(cytidine 5'-diphospho)-2-C-methyl-D-erythritol kinase [Pedobacter flavus]|uniref:4-diphosphocytidyl-2-C-methyl-D-erythritol kinase n=1 Tax=Pedobacter flavus TaxID=3113906 RepID=A0ABU7H1P9_9SPHI|nr:4-(cytidine 5'-diphospho)-2-C-methyl-D-erythritol kinase [Pedobacter sp. VNH31]MEE1885251.1 4-(cytidine 5'-diphospho)-2-C-methyl-D-erythritol kinase [Pedobacter sp. VNH31]
MLEFPNAKINLGLHVTEKRTDGYHNLETILFPIAIKDALEIHDSNELELTINGAEIPGDINQNLCIRAFKLLERDYNLPAQHITLLKNIPIGAGLGGGSSDAAALINLLDRKFELGISVSKKMQYASLLGSDCAFFIENKPVYATGIGNVFEEIELDLKAFKIVVVMPDVHVSTENAYKNIVPRKSDVNLRDVIKQPVGTWKENMRNDFEATVFAAHPVIADLKDLMYSQGALFASMSGSGASVFGIFDHYVPIKLPANYKIYENL